LLAGYFLDVISIFFSYSTFSIPYFSLVENIRTQTQEERLRELHEFHESQKMEKNPVELPWEHPDDFVVKRGSASSVLWKEKDEDEKKKETSSRRGSTKKSPAKGKRGQKESEDDMSDVSAGSEDVDDSDFEEKGKSKRGRGGSGGRGRGGRGRGKK
jgi:hypothetical protein